MGKWYRNTEKETKEWEIEKKTRHFKRQKIGDQSTFPTETVIQSVSSFSSAWRKWSQSLQFKRDTSLVRLFSFCELHWCVISSNFLQVFRCVLWRMFTFRRYKMAGVICGLIQYTFLCYYILTTVWLQYNNPYLVARLSLRNYFISSVYCV